MATDTITSWRGFLFAAAIFAVNAFITLRLFGAGYIDQIQSIDAVFIGLARYIRDHHNDLRWFPLWYGGIPFPDSYPPLLHTLVASVSGLARIPAVNAYHFTVALAYSLGPVALYWTVRQLGAGEYSAAGAALLYSVVAPSCWIVNEVRHDGNGVWAPRRLFVLVEWGEGPHITSLLFLIVSIGLLHLAWKNRRPLLCVAAGLGMTATVLSNWIGAFALTIAVAAYLLSYADRRSRTRVFMTAGIAVFAYMVAMPWAMPSVVQTIRANAPLVGGFETSPTQKIFVFLYPLGLLAVAWILHWRKVPPSRRFGILLFAGMAGIALPAYWFNLSLLPQPKRYHVEMDLAFWMAAALLIRWRPAVLAVVAVLVLPLIYHQHRIAHGMERPLRMEQSAEYRIANWLTVHMPGQRVFAPGNDGFWLNAFGDVPQLTGGFDNGTRNLFIPDVNYQIYAGDKTQVSLDWLRAFGCDAIAGDDPESKEYFHPLAHPGKLHGLQELWRDGPEVIYSTGRVRRSLAHVITAGDLLAARPPAYASDALRPFLAALDDPRLPEAQLAWRGQSAAQISSTLKPDQLVYVQITWDKGWQATVDGQARVTRADVLGQMVIEPHCTGPCVVDLTYTGGTEFQIARVASITALIAAFFWILLSAFDYRRRFSAIMREPTLDQL